MPFQPSAVGSQSKEYTWQYDWRTLATYALGIGAKKDELPYLFEGTKGGIRVFPTIAVVPSYAVLGELMGKTGGDYALVVHGGQKVRMLRPLPPEGTVKTVGTLAGLYNAKKMVQAIIRTTSTMNGEPLFETSWSILFRQAPDFESERAPEDPDACEPPKDKAPDWTHEEATSQEQALLYRLSGDVNPLHADPEFAKAVGFPQGPILHGLATYGFVARAVTKNMLGGDATRLKTFTAQFRKPVWPGDTIVTQGWNIAPGKVAIVASVAGRPDPVLAGSWATFST